MGERRLIRPGILVAWCAGLIAATSVQAPAQPLPCFAEGTPVETLIAQGVVASLSGPQAANVGNGWTQTATDGAVAGRGAPITLTWSVVPDGTAIRGVLSELQPGNFDEGSDPSSLRAFLLANYGDESVWSLLIQDILDDWSAGPGVTFVYEPNDDGVPSSTFNGVLGLRGDIRIAGHFIDGNDSTVAYAFFPANGGDIVIDVPDTFNTTEARFRNVLAHEVGHAIGMGHTCPIDQSKLMEPTISTFFSGPQQDDLLGAHRNYGDFEEENDARKDAADLGLSINMTTLETTLALDGSSDADWFSIRPGIYTDVTINLDPAGSIYPFAVPDGMGSCTGVATILFDPRSVQDLSLEILGSDGTTSLAFSDLSNAGGSESVVDVRVSNSGGFIRIAGGGVDDTQRYEIEVTVVPEPSTLTLQAGALLGLGWLAGWRRISCRRRLPG